MTTVGLRVDVDTFSGTRTGVPEILRQLDQFSINASFFFTLGPDNMGRHLWRLIKPAFLMKMLRSNAPGLYGWDILLRGTFGTGPNISQRLGDTIVAVATAGHEVGLHAWDHHLWQTYVDTMPANSIAKELTLGASAFNRLFKQPPPSSAAPGWKCTETVLLEKEHFCFSYNSDCRGVSIFRPIVNKRVCAPQVPVTLPTYDELIGLNGVTDKNYNETLLALIKPDQFNVLTIHAEVEGMARVPLFADFLRRADDQGVNFVPLIKLLPEDKDIPTDSIIQSRVAGREGNVCWQASALNTHLTPRDGHGDQR